MTFSLVSAALLCNTEPVSLLRCFCWGMRGGGPVAGLGVRFWWGNGGGLALGSLPGGNGCGAALLGVVGRSVGSFAAWGSLGLVLPWFCSLVCLLCACLVLFRLPGFCFSAAKFSLFYFPLGKWRQTLELRVPSSNPGRKSHADPLWEHFVYNNPLKQGKVGSALDKSL
ncbi:Hypothetical_protein [Hexamita inflata]|uniref:Hypothetical_protein n=2 Tax=Hexamita inflata TaxID=28002 RepID=A0AA86NRF4_9EUKA|nr:Hypothetical protein HINF_LOCUS11618 [Hexamita inflata]CAI9978621.1 Hypothetical protein HINF_LOCUS66266 [Hexamita inflata]